MKFGKTMEQAVKDDWKAYSINYKLLKKILPSRKEIPKVIPVDEKYEKFWELFNQCLNTMEGFHRQNMNWAMKKIKFFESKVEKYRLSALLKLSLPRGSPGLSHDTTISELRLTLNDVSEEVDMLLEFYDLNLTAVSKILKKYDKCTFSNIRETKLRDVTKQYPFLDGAELMKIKNKLDGTQSDLLKMGINEEVNDDDGEHISAVDDNCPKRKHFNAMTEKARLILDAIEGDSPFFSSHVKRVNPIFKLEEIEKGSLLGEGEFGTVREIRSFRNVKELCPICFLHQDIKCIRINDGVSNAELADEEVSDMDDSFESDHEEEDNELVAKRGFMNHHCVREGFARYAIKHVKNSLTGDDRIESAIDIGIEAKILSVISHSNIVRLRGTGGTPGYPDYFIILDRLYGTLRDKLELWKKKLNEEKGFFGVKKRTKETVLLWNERLLATYDIACAMKYFHKYDMLYRDLKPENVGFDVRGRAKIFDFGLAKELKPKYKVGNDQYRASGRTGTRRYMAPEVTLCKPYGKSADVYSFAIVFWETMRVKIPFDYKNHEEHAKNVIHAKKRPAIPSSWPTLIKSMLKDAWSDEPSSRPSFDRMCDLLLGEIGDCLIDGIDFSDKTSRLCQRR